MTLTEVVRNRIWTALSPDTAAVAGLSLAQLQQVIAGTVTLTDAQTQALANYFGIEDCCNGAD